MSRKPNPYRDELKLGRSQRRRLETIINNLIAMSEEWDGWHGGLECDFQRLANEISPQLAVMDSQIKDWKEGQGDHED